MNNHLAYYFKIIYKLERFEIFLYIWSGLFLQKGKLSKFRSCFSTLRRIVKKSILIIAKHDFLPNDLSFVTIAESIYTYISNDGYLNFF